MGGNLLWVLFWLKTGASHKHLHKLAQILQKEILSNISSTSNNFQKLTEWINGYRSWVVSRYIGRPRRPSVRQCCLRPGDQKSMENQKISKTKKASQEIHHLRNLLPKFKKKRKFTIFIHFKKERAKNCRSQLTTVDWASLPARGAHPRVASWTLSPTELRLLGWDRSSIQICAFLLERCWRITKEQRVSKAFGFSSFLLYIWVFGNVWWICSLMEPLVTSDLIYQPEPQWCDHYTGLYKSPAVRPHRQERWSFMIVRLIKIMPRGWATLHFKMIAGEQPVICKALKEHVDDKPSMIPLDTIDNSTSNQVVQHLAPTQFLGTTSGHDTTCPNDSLHTNARMLGIFDNANGNLEIGWLTRGSSMRVCPTTILQKTVCKQQSEIRPHRRCKRACLSGGTNTVSFSWGGGVPFFCR